MAAFLLAFLSTSSHLAQSNHNSFGANFFHHFFRAFKCNPMKQMSTILHSLTGFSQGYWRWLLCGLLFFSLGGPEVHAQAITTYPWLETFDSYSSTSALGPWVQDQSDQDDWELDSGGTPSGSTGPSGDHTTGAGNYIYLETSSTGTNDVANLISPTFNLTGTTNPKLEFWYHMYGATINTLNVDIDTGNGWFTVWTLSGNQGDQWSRAVVDLAPYKTATGNVQVRLQAIAGSSYTGDIAIDDVLVFEVPPVDLDVLDVVGPVVPTVGSNSVEVAFINRGGTTLQNETVTVEYQIDNGSWVSESFTINSLPWRDTATFQFTTPWSITTPGFYSLCVRINPQLSGDPDAADALCVTRCTGMSGTYSIGSASTADYQSVSAAVNDLLLCGIDGSVVFNVAPGTYNEQITITEIPGAGPNATVTFDGGDSSQTILTHDGTGTWANVLLDGADWVTVKNFKIVNTASTDGWGVQLTNEANHNTIANNWIVLDPNGSVDLIGVLASGSLTSESTEGNSANYTLVQNNLITGGDYGIYFRGADELEPIVGNAYVGNEIDNTDGHAFYNYYHDSLYVIGNYSHGMRSSTAYGFYGYYLGHLHMERNTFIGNGYGAFSGYINNNSTLRGLIANNIFYGGQYDGAYFRDFEDVDIYNNTFVSDGDHALLLEDATGVDLRNNIMVFRGTASGYYAFASDNVSYTDIDYNIYSSTGNYLVEVGTGYANLAQWQSAMPQFNAHSEMFLPNFLGNMDFHIPASSTFKRGANVGVTLDVDGDIRCVVAPTVGADESNFADPVPVASFAAPDTAWLNSPVTFLNGANLGQNASYIWYVDGVFVSDAFNLNQTFTTAGTVEIKLVATGCSGVDSVTQTVVVASPVQAPEAAFIADDNMLEVFGVVEFTDLSVNGPTSWEWIITPAIDTSSGIAIPTVTYLDGTDEFSQNPVVSFDFTGSYDVCLVATNNQGSDTICYSDYIVVQPTNYLCIFPFGSEEPQGMLYDAGGPQGDYSNAANCTYLIDPCASSVTLNFSEFDLEDGDDFLRVYDGEDNSGTPLWNVSANVQGMTGDMTHPSFVGTMVAQSGKIYIEFESDAGTTAPGFAAAWTSTPGNFTMPVVDFDLPDTACVNIPLTVENISSGADVDYSWDLYNDQMIDASTEDFQFTFNTPGTYALKLSGENCGGMDSVVKNLVVVNPQHAPRAGFMATNLRPALGEVVTLMDTSGYCADSWEWTISPNTYRFVNGTDQFSRFPQVAFTGTGSYDVKLVAGNSVGQDSVMQQNYIFVIDYCNPIVGNLSSDVGISRLMLNGTDMQSSIGEDRYTNYTAGAATTLKVGDVYSLTMERTTTSNPMRRAAWIDFNQDGDFTDAGEQVLSEPASYTLSYTGTFQVPQSATLGRTRMRVGASYGTSNLQPCGPAQFGEYEDYAVVILPDVVIPVITLLGNAVDTIAQCEVYVDSGATAFDNIDGNISSQIVITGTVDESVAGTYQLRYNVSDASGNPAVEVVRTVVVLPDTVAPQIMLTGAVNDTIAVNSLYTDPGSTAMDNCDSSVAVTVSGMVDTSTVGTYVLTYTAQDAEGNIATETRTVVVQDMTPPGLTLVGGDTLYVQLDSAWTDPGASATDNYDTNLVVTVSGFVDTSQAGTYVLTYCVDDAAGNGPICEERVVIVQDMIDPEVVLLIDDTLTVEVFSQFIDPGVEVNDNMYPDHELMITKGGTWPGNTNTLGTYTIVYTVTDPSGNSTTVTRVVEVVDTQAPVIALNDSFLVRVERWTTWNDPGVEVEDNYYPDDSITVVVGGSIDLTQRIDSPPGTYIVTYQAVDPSGNWSQQLTRTIVVEPSAINQSAVAATIEVYPNPTRDRFTLKLELAEREQVRISVLNSVGQEVQVVAETTLQSAKYEVDLTGHRSGVYFVRVQTEEGMTVKKVLLQQ